VILFTTLIYRVSTSMGPLAILVSVTARISLPVASFALAGWTMAGALGPPLWVAVAARLGRRRTLIPLGAVSAAGHVAIGLFPGSILTVSAACLAGATLPPITVQARALLARILEGDQRARAFEIESGLASLAFVLAPLVVGLASTLAQLGPLLVSAALLAGATALYIRAGRGPAGFETGSAHPDRRAKAALNGRVARSWLLLPWTLIVSGTACYAALACVEVSAVARLHQAVPAATVLAAWAASSLLGGLVMARLRRPDRWRSLVLLVPVLAYSALAVLGLSNAWAFSVILVLSGLAVAPTLAILTSEVARVTPAWAQPEAYAWLQLGSWTGSAAVTAAAGLLATHSLRALMLLAALLALGAAVGVRRSAREL
jgi:MFS family permease